MIALVEGDWPRAHMVVSAPMLERCEHAREPLFQIIPNCWAPHLQVSSYMTGDHYDFHEDEGAGVNGARCSLPGSTSPAAPPIRRQLDGGGGRHDERP